MPFGNSLSMDAETVWSQQDTMKEKINENTAYLMALRRPTTTASAPTLARDPAPGPSATPGRAAFEGKEKRRSPRYKCQGSVEMRQEGGSIRTWSTFSDIGLHGCYVEAQASYPVNTMLHLKLEANDISVETKATVRVNYPQVGMGIAFVDMSQENLDRLKQLLTSVSRTFVSMGPATASSLSHSGPKVPLIYDPLAAVQALINYFEGHLVLTREEFLHTLYKSQSSSHP